MIQRSLNSGRLNVFYSAVFFMTALLLLFSMAGCETPNDDSGITVDYPKLKVTAPDLSFGESSTEKIFTIANDGMGNLEWSIFIENEADWCTASPSEGNGNATITIRVNRQKLIEPGTYPATITVNSNGGNTELTAIVITSTGIIIIDTSIPNQEEVNE